MYQVGINYRPEQLVFVDESSVDRRTGSRAHGYSRKGRSALQRVFFVHGRRYLVLPALSLSGILLLDIVEGSFTKSHFSKFIDALLNQMNPFPGPNPVIVMDNCRIHKSELMQEMIVECGMQFEYLLPYLPDYNHIELAFSAMKYYLRRNQFSLYVATEGQNDAPVYALLNSAVFSITPDDAAGWFRKCQYM